MKYLLPIILLLSFCLQPASAADTVVTGKSLVTEQWQGKVLTASFRAGMCFSPDGGAQGVLILRHANGQEDTYHLYGHIKNNVFELKHSSGHIFHGQLISPSEMVGTVKLKNGMRLNLEGERHLDTPLLAEDCAPLK